MSKEQTKDLLKFLEPFSKETIDLVMWLRDFAWDLCPKANELIYDNYNALAVGFAPTDKAGDVFCSLAVYSKHVNFGFNRGSEITDPDKILNGKGSLYRHITIRNKEDFPEKYIQRLLKEAYANAISRLKDERQIIKGQTITKSISKVQRRPQ